MRLWLTHALLALSTVAHAEAPPAATPLPGSVKLAAAPALDGTDKKALAVWRDALLALYRRAALAPFEVRVGGVSDKGVAYSTDLDRDVGHYRVKGDTKGIELIGVELPGTYEKAPDQLLGELAALRELRVWPVRTDGQIVTDCHVEVVQATRAELCLSFPDVTRGEPNVVSTELRVMAVCPSPKLDDLAVVWLSPVAPAAFTPVVTEPAAPSFAFLGGAAARELVCTEGRNDCVSVTTEGELVIEHGDQPVSVTKEDLAGFTLKGIPSRFVGVEHKPTGLRVLRSAIGTYHGLPPASLLRDLLAAGDCLIWQLRPPTVKKYPARVDLGTLCLADGAWLEGLYAATTLHGVLRQAVQSARIDDVATRCKYTSQQQPTDE